MPTPTIKRLLLAKGYTTLDPANTGGSLSGDKLTFTTSAGQASTRSIAQMPATGLIHFEVTANDSTGGTFGIVIASHPTSGASSWIGGGTDDSFGSDRISQYLFNANTRGTLSPSFTLAAGETVAIETDVAAKSISFKKEGGGWSTPLFFNSFPNIPAPYYAAVGLDTNTSAGFTVNFGATAWRIAPNAGYTGLRA